MSPTKPKLVLGSKEPSQPVSERGRQAEKVKKEILPLLDDESMDELDGEVAMISNKMPDHKSSEGGSGDLMTSEEVKIALKREQEA